MRYGEMVKGDGPSPMRLLGIEHGVAECLLIDSDGVVRRLFQSASTLRPIREVFRPRTCWRETSGFDLIEIEKEERAASEARRQKRRAAKKAKRSQRIKRCRPPEST